MIILNISGGLGNQLFQYAFGRYLSSLLGKPLFVNTELYTIPGNSNRTFDLDIFAIGDCITGNHADIERMGLEEKETIVIKERHFHYDEELICLLKEMHRNEEDKDLLFVVSGYWQSYKYFQPIEQVLRKDFTFLAGLTGRWNQLNDGIGAETSVMINVRRGDYLQKLGYHGVVSKEYLEKAIAFFHNKIAHPVFYVFSDDIPWCREALSGKKDIFYVDESYYDSKYQFYLQLMIGCKHFILSNSTYCWWAAWLCGNKDKIVIAPEKWFADGVGLDTRDLLPTGWLKF